MFSFAKSLTELDVSLFFASFVRAHDGFTWVCALAHCHRRGGVGWTRNRSTLRLLIASERPPLVGYVARSERGVARTSYYLTAAVSLPVSSGCTPGARFCNVRAPENVRPTSLQLNQITAVDSWHWRFV